MTEQFDAALARRPRLRRGRLLHSGVDRRRTFKLSFIRLNSGPPGWLKPELLRASATW
jgi:hypothetical protein